MTLPVAYEIDFSIYKKDLIEEALEKMLSQHYSKCVLRQFVAAIMKEVQVLYDALIELQRQRTVFWAEDENLDALGRIVGQERDPWEYTENNWMFFDRDDQTYNKVPVWCLHGFIGQYVPMEDAQYRVMIISKAIKNHALTASIPELTFLAELFMGVTVSFLKISANRVRILVPANISTTNLILLTRSIADARVDDSYLLPYPVTLDFDGVAIYEPNSVFMFDSDTQTYDTDAVLAVVIPTIAR